MAFIYVFLKVNNPWTKLPAPLCREATLILPLLKATGIPPYYGLTFKFCSMKNVTMYTENLKIVGLAILYMAVILVCSALLT